MKRQVLHNPTSMGALRETELRNKKKDAEGRAEIRQMLLKRCNISIK